MEQVKSKTGTLSQSRREFIERAGISVVMSSFGLTFFTGCSDSEDQNPTNPTPSPPTSTTGITITGSTITIDLTTQTGLAAAGGWLLILSAKTLVVNVGGAYMAMTSVCTHSACDRNWTFTNNRFTCTCHGSQFDTSGNVLQGPATQPLQSYATALSGTSLTITK
ncbi:ubiquinol-cytochrome c reductase iron-sulfur subunit [Algoriphagus winogradskyi]|uniref:Cytochrome b6-f complex iron-sulfur subunit n=1 Tax=Algoriphagus winogradskyi TaxID=237017 RepID=A0ABY1P6R9_9BACT|nr:Rieske (2Fe-2S) protein [Algoriphagus winogradskyi]SMP25411.1 cytochrome b6-f complex iron-sulfur subunit [Algoriphagus winogradskyi]